MTREEFSFIKDSFSQIIDDIAGNPDWQDSASAIASNFGTLERRLEKKVKNTKSIKGWVARDEDGDLNLFDNSDLRIAYDEDYKINYWKEKFGGRGFGLDYKLFPNLKYGDNPIEVELIIRPL